MMKYLSIVLTSFLLTAGLFAEDFPIDRWGESGDTVFSGNVWHLKNINPFQNKNPLDLPFVETDSTVDLYFGWCDETNIQLPEVLYNPETAIVNNSIYLSWFTGNVYCINSNDFGFNWTSPIQLNPIDTWASTFSNIHSNDSLVFVVFRHSEDDGVYLCKTLLGETQWSDTITVTVYLGGGNPFTYRPDITGRDSELFVTYEGFSQEIHNQRFKKSTDNGVTWINERVVGGVATGRGAEIAFGDGVLHVIRGSAGHTDVRYDRSTDLGETWSDDSFLSDIDGNASQWPSVAADPYGNVYATWFDFKDSPYCCTGYLNYRRSTDHGETWETIKYLSTDALAHWSDIYADSFGVYVVWDNGEPGSLHRVNFRHSTDQGVSWSPEICISDTTVSSSHMNIDGDGRNLSVCWLLDTTIMSDYIAHRYAGWFIPGDADASNAIDISDAVHLIGYIFSGGIPPIILNTGDADCTGSIDISDAVYLIAYIFGGGPEPCI